MVQYVHLFAGLVGGYFVAQQVDGLPSPLLCCPELQDGVVVCYPLAVVAAAFQVLKRVEAGNSGCGLFASEGEKELVVGLHFMDNIANQERCGQYGSNQFAQGGRGVRFAPGNILCRELDAADGEFCLQFFCLQYADETHRNLQSASQALPIENEVRSSILVPDDVLQQVGRTGKLAYTAQSAGAAAGDDGALPCKYIDLSSVVEYHAGGRDKAA